MGVQFFINSSLLGFGVAMDAFSVSLANGLNEPQMSKAKMISISFVFGFFQAIMPFIGWVCLHTILNKFKVIEKFVPWIAFFILIYIGGKMIYDCFKIKQENIFTKITLWGVIVQAIATSIDALSVGFSIANYSLFLASLSSFIIFSIAFIICIIGFYIGKRFGNTLSNKAGLFGGIILILIGLEILALGLK